MADNDRSWRTWVRNVLRVRTTAVLLATVARCVAAVIVSLVERLRNVRCVVFLESRGVLQRCFVGIASPRAIRWRFARHYPWLEAAFVHAYAQMIEVHCRSISAHSRR